MPYSKRIEQKTEKIIRRWKKIEKKKCSEGFAIL